MRNLPLLFREPSRRAALGGLAATAFAGCAMDRGPKTTELRFIVEADELINPNNANIASPVVLRFYELKQLNAFLAATLFELLDNDTTVLGQDLIAKREIEIKPGEKLKFERSTPIETHYVGIIAGFRVLDVSKWRASLEITPERSSLIVVKVTAQTVSIDLKEDKFLGFF